MYSVSSNFLTAISQPGRVLKSKATVAKTGYTSLNLTDAQIMSIKHDATSISGEDFEIGTTCAAELDIEIANFDNSFSASQFQGAVITASIGVLLADNVTVEYCPLGMFYVDSVSRTDTSIKVVCYDAMITLEALYQSTLTYPATLLQIAQDIAGKTGLALATTDFTNYLFSVSATPSFAGVTLRAALSWIAEAAAGFARVNRSGQLEIVGYSSSSTAITPANYFTLTHDDTSRAAITKVTIRASDSDAGVSSGTAGNTYTITGNPLLANNPSGALTAIYNVLNGFTYMPFAAKWQGNPACMAGDIISITDRNNNTYSTVFTESEIEYAGGLTGNVAAKALSTQAQTYQTATPVEQATQSVAAVVQNQQTINNLLAGNITATNIAARSLTADRLQAGTITAASGVIANAAIGTAQIADASITGAKIGSATITAANIANATITNTQIANAAIGTTQIASGAITTALIGTGAVNTAHIADGSITDAKIVTLTANKITAGTIDASKITVTNLNCANLTVGTINGTQIATGAITATHIADGTITSTELAAAVNTSISNAQNTANNAASAAAAAQTSANGKNTIYRQSTQPSGGTYAADDVWFDTGNGNRVYIYASGAWTLSQLGYQAISSIDAGTISTGTLSAARIGAASITGTMIAGTTITAANIVSSTITASQIAAGTITATQIASATITGDRLVAGTITASQIAASTITGNKIAGTTITAANIAAGTITAAQIASATITGGNIAGTTITGSNISAGTITGDKIAASTITASNIDVTNLSVYKVQAQSDSTAFLTMTSAGMSLYRGSNLSLTITADSGSNYASIIPKGTYNGLWLGTDSASNTSANGLWVTASGCFFYSGSWGQISLGYGNWVTFTTSGGTVYYLGGSSGQRWSTVPIVDTTGVMEVGQYIDFHETSGDTSDYGSRLYSSGGTLTTMGNFSCKGQITLPGSTYPQIIGNGTVLQMNLDSTTSANGLVIAGGTVRPPGDANVNLGASGHRWATVYAATGTINTSDRNEKNTIASLDTDRAAAFISALNPVSFKYNNGTSGRTHYGMIAQDVESSMTELGMTSLDFAGLIKSQKVTEEYGTDAGGNPTLTETPIEGKYLYGLRYEEFISPLIKTVQGLLARCAALEKIVGTGVKNV